MNSIEELALQWAREAINRSDKLGELAKKDCMNSDESTKAMVELFYEGGWKAFCQQTLDQVVA